MQRFDLNLYPIFTDNYSPIEYSITKTLFATFHPTHDNFDSDESLMLIQQQLDFGPRYLSAPGHKKEELFLGHEMTALTQQTIVQRFTHNSVNGSKNELANIIGRINPGNTNRIILATY